MEVKPRVRPVEAFPVQENGKTFICLKDPLNLAQPIGISPVGYFIFAHLDGRHAFIDIQEAYAKQFGALLPSAELTSFIELLDEHYFLDSERFASRQSAAVSEFAQLRSRPAAHVGGVYKADPEDLFVQLDGYFAAPDGPGLPSTERSAPAPKAIVAPHIDFHRGGPAYAWAYKPLVESEGADLYIVLGTCHCSGRTPYILTAKDFETPLGPVETDKNFVAQLQAAAPEDLFLDEYLHKGEHSIEFQTVFLKYAARKRAALAGQTEKPFKIVPILVSSFHSALMRGTPPESERGVGAFLRALGSMAAADPRKVCFVAGVDFAHVGRQFGDREAITAEFLKWVEGEDSELLNRLLERDRAGFFQHLVKDHDRRRICGFSPLYSLIHLLNGAEGKLLKYGQAFTPETGSAVSFASVVFR